MPRPVSPQILEAKKAGRRFNLVHLELDTDIYLADREFDAIHDNNTYLANGLLLNVDAGALTAGVQSNDWEVEVSAVLDEVYSGVLSQNLLNRWVYHYVAYWEEAATGIEVIGVEPKKFGQILSHPDMDDNTSAEVTFTITGPLGNVEQANEFKTNVVSHQRRFPGDFFFRYAHETDFKVSPGRSNGLVGPNDGTPIDTIPADVE